MFLFSIENENCIELLFTTKCKKGGIYMKMQKCKNGLWKCSFKNLEFYTSTISEAIAIAWKLGGRI